MRKTKILFVHQNLDIGGAEVLRKHLLSYLNKERYSADICSIEKKGMLGEEIEKSGFKVITLGKRISVINSISILYNLYILIRRNKYDAIHTSLFYANLFGRVAGILAGTPLLIIEEHGIYKWKDKYPIFIWADRALAKFTYKIICCSESVRDFTVAQERLAKNKFVVIKNCLDFNSFNIYENREVIKKRYSFSTEETIIGIVGTLRKEKGHLYLIEAVNILSKKYNNIRLMVIGDGLLRDTLKALVSKLDIDDKVLFLGWRFDLPYLLRIMDIFVLPSISEGLGISILEAMYAGVPVVATNVGGIPEIIRDGLNGLLVPPCDSKLLARAIERLILDRTYASKLAAKGREIVMKDFSATEYVATIENIYANFFNGKRV